MNFLHLILEGFGQFMGMKEPQQFLSVAQPCNRVVLKQFGTPPASHHQDQSPDLAPLESQQSHQWLTGRCLVT